MTTMTMKLTTTTRLVWCLYSLLPSILVWWMAALLKLDVVNASSTVPNSEPGQILPAPDVGMQPFGYAIFGTSTAHLIIPINIIDPLRNAYELQHLLQSMSTAGGDGDRATMNQAQTNARLQRLERLQVKTKKLIMFLFNLLWLLLMLYYYMAGR